MKIWYENFYPGFDPNDCFFTDILEKNNQIEITPEKPDVLIYSIFGNINQVLRYKCKKIFWTGEHILVGTNPVVKVSTENYPNDVSLSFDPDSKTNIQCPLWITYLNYSNPNHIFYYQKTTEKRSFQNKNQYCNFIYSNPAIEHSPRFEFFKFLSNKRLVHSAGRYANNIGYNIGGQVEDKLNYIKDFVFTIAFENSYNDYYTTEKLLQPLLATSIPIYWGGQESLKHFNLNTLINAYGRSFEEIENEMNELLEDKDRIIEMCTLPIFEKFPEQFLPETIATKIKNII